jgi:hypothetical protein
MQKVPALSLDAFSRRTQPAPDARTERLSCELLLAAERHRVSIQPEEWPEGVQSDDDTETRPWHTFLIETLIAVLPGLAVQS